MRDLPPKTMAARNIHVWKSTTAEGEKRELRAEKFGGKWRLQAQVKGEDSWTYYDSPEIPDLLELREVLWRKYQRKRVTFDDITTVEKLIKERGGTFEPLH